MATRQGDAATKTRSSSGQAGSGRTALSGNTTTDHDEIRRWVEERGGKPATVKRTHQGEDAGILRIDFPDGPEPALEEIGWEEFFEKFEEKQLAFLHQD